MPLTVGGGVRTVEDIRKLLLAGADKVSINTAAVNNPDFVREAAEKFGNQCIVVAIDAKKVSDGTRSRRWEIFTHGGRTATGIDAIAFARRWRNSAQANCSSPPWTGTAPRAATSLVTKFSAGRIVAASRTTITSPGRRSTAAAS